MKKSLIALSILLASLVLPTGCTSTKQVLDDPNKVQAIASVITTATTIGVWECTKAHPESAKIFAVISEVISIALAQDIVQPAAIDAMIADALTKKGYADQISTARLVLQVAMTNYASFYRLNWETYVNARPAMKTFLMAIQQGLTPAYPKTTNSQPSDLLLTDAQLKM